MYVQVCMCVHTSNTFSYQICCSGCRVCLLADGFAEAGGVIGALAVKSVPLLLTGTAELAYLLLFSAWGLV